MSLFLAVKVSFRVVREEIYNKKERILIRYIYSFRGLHIVRPHPDLVQRTDNAIDRVNYDLAKNK